MPEEGEEKSGGEGVRTVRSAADLQRIRLEKLMANPEKPAFIPPPSREKSFPAPPEFVRNVMGSSAGAGSGEFHVYRHIRRREYARQQFLDQMSEKDRLDYEYKERLEQNKRITEEKAAKKRSKRQKSKLAKKLKRKAGGAVEKKVESATESESDDDSEDVAGKNGDGNKESEQKQESSDEDGTDSSKPEKKSLKQLLSQSETGVKLAASLKEEDSSNAPSDENESKS